MKRTILPLAIAGMMAVLPAAAQQAFETAQGPASIAPVSDVVLAVEQRLQQLGYDVRPDGQFDADLLNSVMLFQSDNGLRPTGNVDLNTIAALGIDVDPAGTTTAMVQPEPGDQMAMAPLDEEPAQQTAAVVDDDSVDYPLLKDEHMSAPQIGGDARFDRLENFTGVPQPQATLLSEVPGIEPGFPVENFN